MRGELFSAARVGAEVPDLGYVWQLRGLRAPTGILYLHCKRKMHLFSFPIPTIAVALTECRTEEWKMHSTMKGVLELCSQLNHPRGRNGRPRLAYKGRALSLEALDHHKYTGTGPAAHRMQRHNMAACDLAFDSPLHIAASPPTCPSSKRISGTSRCSVPLLLDTLQKLSILAVS